MAYLVLYLSGLSVFVLCSVQVLHLADAGAECKCTCRGGGAQALSRSDDDLIPNIDDCEDLFCCMEAPVGSRICQRIINCQWDDDLQKCVPRPELLLPWTTTTTTAAPSGIFDYPFASFDCGVLNRATYRCTNNHCHYDPAVDDCMPTPGIGHILGR